MELSNFTLRELEEGFRLEQDARAYRCIFCGRMFRIGEVYPSGGHFYGARLAAEIHLAEEHGSALEALLESGDPRLKITGRQKQLLRLMHRGMPDSGCAAEMGVSPSTVRHQKFVLRERAKQARLFLAAYELAARKAGADTGDPPVRVPETATMTDDRYLTSEAESEKIRNEFFSSQNPLCLKAFPAKEKKKIVVLTRISEQFEKGRVYSEREVNDILKPIFADYATLRRYLIEYGLMSRTPDGSEYRLNGKP
jgi:hypothetical protein